MLQNKENLKFLIDMLNIKEQEDNDIIESLFELKLETINNCLKKNKKYCNNIKNIYNTYEEIEKINNDKNLMNLIEEWMCLVNENNVYINEIHYKTGLKDGVNIVITGINEEL